MSYPMRAVDSTWLQTTEHIANRALKHSAQGKHEPDGKSQPTERVCVPQGHTPAGRHHALG